MEIMVIGHSGRIATHLRTVSWITWKDNALVMLLNMEELRYANHQGVWKLRQEVVVIH